MQGFWRLTASPEEHNAEVANRRCRALTAKVRMGGRELILAKPETFMNLSGLSVGALADELEIELPGNLLVLYDELDLPLGTLRVRERGSPAGHNGARSVSGVSGNGRVVAGSDWSWTRAGSTARRLFGAARIIC